MIVLESRKMALELEVDYRLTGGTQRLQLLRRDSKKARGPERALGSLKFRGLMDVDEWKDTMSCV